MSSVESPGAVRQDNPRSFLSIPAMLLPSLSPNQINALGADVVAFDLEDSVRPEHKVYARGLLAQFLANVSLRAACCVRVNERGSEWWEEDFRAFDGVIPLIIPKVTCEDDIPAGASEVIPVIETVAGLSLVHEIGASSARVCNVFRVIFGKEDLLADMGQLNPAADSTNPIPTSDLRHNTTLRDIFLYMRRGSRHGVEMIEGVTKTLDRSPAGLQDLAAECEYAKALGASGKVAIHQYQAEVIDAVFASESGPEPPPAGVCLPDLAQDFASVPHAEEKLENAQRIVKAFEENTKRQNITSVDIDGSAMMVGPPMYHLAKVLLEKRESGQTDTRCMPMSHGPRQPAL